MTRQFKSRVLLAALLGAASLVWLGDLLSQAGHAAAKSAREPAPLITADHAEEPPVPTLAVASAIREWVALNAMLPDGGRADPFLYLEDIPAAPSVEGGSSRGHTLPVVRGISLGAGKPLAVLDRTVVGEGDEMGPWRIEKIEADTVWLASPGGKVGLHVSRGPGSTASPPAMESPRPKERKTSTATVAPARVLEHDAK